MDFSDTHYYRNFSRRLIRLSLFGVLCIEINKIKYKLKINTIMSEERKTIYLCLAHMSEDGMEQKYVKEAFDTNWGFIS